MAKKDTHMESSDEVINAVELPQTGKQRERAIRYPKGMPFKIVDLAFINGDWQNVAL